MRESRVVPLRLIPTMKTGESVEHFDEIGFIRLFSGSDTKNFPQSRALLFRRSRTPVLHFQKLRLAMDQSKRFSLIGCIRHHIHRSSAFPSRPNLATVFRTLASRRGNFLMSSAAR